MCFLLEEKDEPSHLFTGDHIIGADSTFFVDYPKYLASLDKVRDLTLKYNIKNFFVAHSYTLNLEDVMLEALPKVEDQIAVRKQKD